MATDKQEEVRGEPGDYEVLEPPTNLDHVIVPGGSDHDAAAEAIARAEQALDTLSEHFDGWMDDDLAALMEARERARRLGLSAETRDTLFSAAHDMKGQAGTLGFPEAASVAAVLCRLLEGVPDPVRIPGALVDQHVDGIRALVHEHGNAGYEARARELVERLAMVTLEFVDQERERVGLPPYGQPTAPAKDKPAKDKA